MQFWIYLEVLAQQWMIHTMTDWMGLCDWTVPSSSEAVTAGWYVANGTGGTSVTVSGTGHTVSLCSDELNWLNSETSEKLQEILYMVIVLSFCTLIFFFFFLRKCQTQTPEGAFWSWATHYGIPPSKTNNKARIYRGKTEWSSITVYYIFLCMLYLYMVPSLIIKTTVIGKSI